MSESFCDWTHLVIGLAASVDAEVEKTIETKAKERVDVANKRTEEWRSKAIAADLTRNLREQEIVDLRNQLRHAATRLNVKNGETDKMRVALDDAVTLIQSYRVAEEDYIEKLDEMERYIEQLKRQVSYEQSMKRGYFDSWGKTVDVLESVAAQNAWLKRPLWVKIVGWFAR